MADKDEILRKIERETWDALSSTVKIGWEQVLKLVVEDLIGKRNACREIKDRDAFDRVLLYYLGGDDFEKYVINKKKIKI